MTAATGRPRKAKWSLWRAFTYGLFVGIALFVMQLLTDSGKEFSVWLNTPLAETIGYFSGRFLFFPVVFIAVAFIRNLFVKTAKSKSRLPVAADRALGLEVQGNTLGDAGVAGSNFIVKYWRGGYSLALSYLGVQCSCRHRGVVLRFRAECGINFGARLRTL